MTEKMSDKSEYENEGTQVSGRFFMFLMLGFAIVIIGIILVVGASFLGGGSASVGVVIFIGPFPIMVGAGPDAVWPILIGIAISVVMVLALVLMSRRNRGESSDRLSIALR